MDHDQHDDLFPWRRGSTLAYSAQTGQNAAEIRLDPDHLEMSPGAEHHAARLGVSAQMVVQAWNEPDEEWPSRDGRSTTAVRNGVAVCISHVTGVVLSVSEADYARRWRPEERTPSIPRGRGGAGRRYPTDFGDLLSDLRSRGFNIQVRSGGHIGVTSPDGHTYICSSTPSDSRSVINAIKSMERYFKMSLARKASR